MSDFDYTKTSVLIVGAGPAGLSAAITLKHKNPNAKIIKGGIYRGIVADIGKKGDGIIKINGKVTFIPGVEKGDKCLFKIIDTQSSFNRGTLIKIE